MQGELDVLVVGAGVVGLAAAAALAAAGRGVAVAERHDGFGRETSSRNSQVIHAGLYDPAGSLKTRCCVRGRRLLLERCARDRVPHLLCGKLIVATSPDELPALEALAAGARENGVGDLAWLDRAALRRREPCVDAVAALHSPGSGIVDAHALLASYAAEAEARGAEFAFRTDVLGAAPRAGGFRVDVRNPDGSLESVGARAVVNAAGLGADRLAERVGLDVEAAGLRQRPCKGDYFALAPGAPLRFRGLVYPVRRDAGLGIHVTPDLGGRVRLGPDATFVEAPHYTVDPGKAGAFAAAVRRFVPALEASWLAPDQAGVRPKLSGPGEPPRDFVVREESAAGLPGWVDLVGIESPGLTAAGALAEEVARLLA